MTRATASRSFAGLVRRSVAVVQSTRGSRLVVVVAVTSRGQNSFSSLQNLIDAPALRQKLISQPLDIAELYGSVGHLHRVTVRAAAHSDRVMVVVVVTMVGSVSTVISVVMMMVMVVMRQVRAVATRFGSTCACSNIAVSRRALRSLSGSTEGFAKGWCGKIMLVGFAISQRK